jgi:hypothetical protein
VTAAPPAEPPADEHPPGRRHLDPLPLVLAGVAVGLVVTALHHAQQGLYVVAASLALGGALRLVLRPRDAGSLVVRSRRLDVLVLVGLAVALGVVAAVTPFPAGRS